MSLFSSRACSYCSLLARRTLSTVPPKPLNLTPAAIAQLSRVQTKNRNTGLALRLSVESGGCHGYQYKMALADVAKEGEVDGEEDNVLQFPPDKPPNTDEAAAMPLVVIDNVSLHLCRGATIDFATELIGSAFKVTDNPQSKSKGCGCGVSWELRDDFDATPA